MNGLRWEVSSSSSSSSASESEEEDLNDVQRRYLDIGKEFLDRSQLHSWFAKWPKEKGFNYCSDCCLDMPGFTFLGFSRRINVFILFVMYHVVESESDSP